MHHGTDVFRHPARTARRIATYCLVPLLIGCGSGAPDAPLASDTLVAVNGTRLYVHREGRGEAIVVIHGGPLLDHGYLVEPLRPLASTHQLVFYDQRLSGRSDGRVDSASITLDTFAGDIEGLRRALGLGRIHLLGHSWGGLLAMKYALAHPEQLRSLILVSPMAPSSRLWQEEEEALRAALQPEDTAGMGALRSSPGMAAGEPATVERLLRLSFRSQLHDPARAAGLRFHIARDYGERSRQFARLAEELSSYDLVEELESLRVPTLLVRGASEPAAAAGVEALEEAIPGIVIRTIPEAGHFSFLEQPESFLSVVRAFLAER